MWAAANVSRHSPSSALLDHRRGGGEGTTRPYSETVEAALARLTKAYSSAMACVGALHRLQQEQNEHQDSQQQQQQQQDYHSELRARVATAARSALEQAILLDPLIVNDHAATWKYTYDQVHQQQQQQQEQPPLPTRRPAPPKLTSSSHRATVRQLAYLSLVNYADLLLLLGTTTTTVSSSSSSSTTASVVPNESPPLLVLDTTKTTTTSSMQRLALSALCDAVHVDGTDPTVWLKLAGAARLFRYRRLERHALEQGSVALPPHVPPHRSVVKALKKLQREEEEEEEECRCQDYYPPDTTTTTQPSSPTCQILLELPRYSWSILGRLLLRVCREGSAFGGRSHHHQQQQPQPQQPRLHHSHDLSSSSALIVPYPNKAQNIAIFGSPRVQLKLSPMLILPTCILGTLCLYLDAPSTSKLEATCRALSVLILSARTLLERQDRRHHPNENEESAAAEEKRDGTEQLVPPPDVPAVDGGSAGATPAAADSETTSAARQNVAEPTARSSSSFSQRASKRVRSQLITSGKLAERKSKRNSVEFCLLAATLGCEATDPAYRQAIAEEQESSTMILDARLPFQLLGRDEAAAGVRGDDNNHRDTSEVRGRLGNASLMAFMAQCEEQNLGPLDVLSIFLTHVSWHVEEVFASEADGSMGLGSNVMDCLDVLSTRCGLYSQPDPFWHGPKFAVTNENALACVENFAVNLLHGELRLKRSEREMHGHHSDDVTLLTLLVPNLLQRMDELDAKGALLLPGEKWVACKARCHWLASGFYLWWSRMTNQESAEQVALEHIDAAVQCLHLQQRQFSKPMIRTPHLESMARSEPHWKVLSVSNLTAFRDEIQAASVVTLARDRFHQKVSEMKQKVRDRELHDTEMHGTEIHDAETTEVSLEDQKGLTEIGEGLFRRYDLPYEGIGGKHDELLEDFLQTCGDDLLEDLTSANKNDDGNHSQLDSSNLWSLVPSRTLRLEEMGRLANPSVLTILATCLQARSGSKLNLVLLLTRLLLSAYEQQCRFLSRISNSKSGSGDFRDDDEGSNSDDSYSSDEDVGASGSQLRGRANADEDKFHLIGGAIRYLTEKTADMFVRCLDDAEQSQYAASPEFLSLIHYSFAFSSEWCQHVGTKISGRNAMIDFETFLSLNALVETIVTSGLEVELTRKIESTCFVGLVSAIVAQVRNFGSILRPRVIHRLGRSARQKLCLDRARLVGAMACEAACLLSKSLAQPQLGIVNHSRLIQELNRATEPTVDGEPAGSSGHTRGLAQLAESLLALWDFVTGRESRRRLTISSSASFDRPIAEMLAVPVASLIVSLCGSALTSERSSTTNVSVPDSSDALCLSEFYDTDSSANDWIAQDETEVNFKRRELIRAVSQAVHCVALVYDAASDKLTSGFKPDTDCDGKCGSLLPLVTSRVLNNFADILLIECGDVGEEREAGGNVWSLEWPFGTRAVGHLLDSTLHIAYYSLHGFSLDQTNSGTTGDEAIQVYPPESIYAAVRLYRCIKRTFSGGRRSPPKAAYECVLSALPEMKDSDRTRLLKGFLFGAARDDDTAQDVTRFFMEGTPLNAFKSLPDWIWESSAGRPVVEKESEAEDILLVRKGICHELAQGPLPVFSAGSSDHPKSPKAEGQKAEERLDAERIEFELAKKFDAIFDDLCLGDLVNSYGWYSAAQCLFLKAEVIADRLGLSKGFSRADDFQVPGERTQSRPNLLSLSDLITAQTRSHDRNLEGWVSSLGRDLSVFIRFPWSSFSSLEKCAREVSTSELSHLRAISQGGGELEEHERFRLQVLKEIESLNLREQYADWQQAWGGIFVSALRIMATRCRCVALAMTLRRTNDEQASAANSDIAEAQAIAYYSDLMAAQCYGYPLRVMTDYWKRQLAEAARLCFQLSAEAYTKTSGDDDTSEVKVTWDLQFMIGKCHEKIASTYKQEAFSSPGVDAAPQGTSSGARMYERHMKEALKCYSISLAEAEGIEKDGGFADVQGGGSCHGATEVFYRLHASRLKCLLWAVRVHEDERDRAENEAIRLTGAHWYQHDDSRDESSAEPRDLRLQVWTVLSDIVSALAQCRLSQPFFHRSVYRHAQALMWANVLYDPLTGHVEGSLGIVPATKSHLLRGLNSSTPCVNSAEVVMASLFEKKRAQLCAVWLTNSSAASSPFEVLNNSVRKYDSLRGKYLSAYISTLKLGRRIHKLETLAQWTAAARRDLPSFFYASARQRGQAPATPHVRETLLVKRSRSLESYMFLRIVKRQVNAALADVLLQQQDSSESSSNKMDAFKMAYTCFLRLNCSIKDLERTRAFKYGHCAIPEVEALCSTFLAREDHEEVYTNAKNDNWSGGAYKAAVLRAALAKGKELFPSLENHAYGKRKKSAKKKSHPRKESETTNNVEDDNDENRKRKAPEQQQTSRASFIVTTPEGLHAGDKFTTTIKVGDVLKTIKVTVPRGSPSKIKFSLKLPATNLLDESSKRQRTDASPEEY